MSEYGYVDVGKLADYANNQTTGITANEIMRFPRADVQPIFRWISVKDCVPEAGVHVLVTDGIHMMVTWCEYIDNQCLWVDNYYEYVNVRFEEVTHWMPLPELPTNMRGEDNG